MSAELQLVSPFPREHFSTLLSWMREFPDCNFDDLSPKNADELGKTLIAKQQAGERLYLVTLGGEPVGAIGYAVVSPYGAMFRGICFTESVHGSGIPMAACKMVLAEIFQLGIETVVAVVFADNLRIRKFLAKLGAEAKTTNIPPAKRNGEPVRLRAYAIHADTFQEVYGSEIRKGVPNAAGLLGESPR